MRGDETTFGLYVELLKRSLTDTLYEIEPDADNPSETAFVVDFIKHYIKGRAVSMLPLVRFDNLQYCITRLIEEKVPGDLIETGVWRGGASIYMRAVLRALGVNDRTVWVADSFEGLPEPDAEKFPIEAKTHSGPVMKNVYNHFAASLEEVKANFKAYGQLDEQVKFLKGWFKDTLPAAPIKTLALMRLDGDYYESTMDSLINLYDKLSVNGYLIIDDYGEKTWTYCRKAVEDFRRERNIDDEIIQVDSKCVYWRKTG